MHGSCSVGGQPHSIAQHYSRHHNAPLQPTTLARRCPAAPQTPTGGRASRAWPRSGTANQPHTSQGRQKNFYWKVRAETVAQPDLCLVKIWTLQRFEQIHGRHHLRRPRHCPDAAAARHERGEPSVKPPHAPPVLLLHSPPPVQHNSARHSAHAEEGNLRSIASQSAPPHMQITVQQQHGRVSPYFEDVTRWEKPERKGRRAV
jgi:hypothetical protein